MRRFVWMSFVLASCAAAPASDAGTDAATTADAGVEAVPCEEPDRECPPAVPYSGGPCEGELFCTYDDDDESEARCVGGAWSAIATCPGCVLPLAEYCHEPFTGTLDGATVTMGPPGAGRAFEEGEAVELIIGAQGSPMIAFELRVEGAESPPDCVARGIALSWDGGSEIASGTPVGVRLHCGTSRTILLIPPGLPCDGEEHDLSVRVPVEGIGEASARLRVADDGCAG